MKRSVIGIISFLAEYGVLVLFCSFMSFSSDFTCRLIYLYFMIQILFGHYRTKTNLIWDEVRVAFTSHCCFCLTSLILEPIQLFNARYVIVCVIIACFMFVFNLFFARAVRIIIGPVVIDHVLVIGTGQEAVALQNVCQNNRFLMMDIVGFVGVNEEISCLDFMEENKPRRNEKPYMIAELESILSMQEVDMVVIAVPDITKSDLDCFLNILKGKVKQIKYVPSTQGIITFDSKIEDFDGLLLISSVTGTASVIQKIEKRIIDIFISILGCIVLIPLTLYVKYVNLKNGDKDPILFTQSRIGKNGKSFKMYKFRTMVPGAEKELERLMEEFPEIKAEYLECKKLSNDPRITEAGKQLRHCSLDEFPQMINVLKGDMSFVGPRPYLEREKMDMGIYYNSIIEVKPGITGMWQTHGRSDVNFDDRCRMDDYYNNNWSIWLDITIMIKTLKTVIGKKGAK